MYNISKGPQRMSIGCDKSRVRSSVDGSQCPAAPSIRIALHQNSIPRLPVCVSECVKKRESQQLVELLIDGD